MSSTIATGSTSVVFPSEGYQVLSTLVHLLGCSVLSFCFARRLEWSTISKFCAMAIFFDSWLFVFSGGVVVSGIGMSLNNAACLSGIYLCIIFYGSSKMLIYVFLAEKVHLVWAAGLPIRRFQSRIWIICTFVLLGYVVIFILMLIARIGYLTDSDPTTGRQTCIIGLEPMASIPLLSYDVFLNIFLTSLFAYPLLGGSGGLCGINFNGLATGSQGSGGGGGGGGGRKLVNPKLRALAKRTCYAASVALGTSVVNILILTLLHGQQLGWVCLASCGFDVTVNATVIFLITRKVHGDDQPSSKPRPVAGIDKETNMPNHVILTRHYGLTEMDLNEITTTTGGGGSSNTPKGGAGGQKQGGQKQAQAERERTVSPKHRKSTSNTSKPPPPPPPPPSSNHYNVFSTKRTRPTMGGLGGYGTATSEFESRGGTIGTTTTGSLSAIGDFAVTRDDGDGTVSGVVHTSSGVVHASSVGVGVGGAGYTGAAGATGAGATAASGGGGGGGGRGWGAAFRGRGKKDQRGDAAGGISGIADVGGGAVQMVPVLLRVHSTGTGDGNGGQEQTTMTSTFSLDDLKEEEDLDAAEPRTPGSIVKTCAFGDDDDE